MTLSRLFILGALLTVAPAVKAQPAAPAPAAAKAPAKAKAAKAPKAPAADAAAQTAPAPAGAATQAAPAAKAAKGAKGAKAVVQAAPAAPAAPVAAQYPFGLVEAKVRTVRNQVEVAGTDRRAAKKDDTILPGQKVSTQAQSSAEVSYADGTRVIVGENSELSLYGVAPPPPAPSKKPKKPPAFKPGTTTLLKGDVVLIVPAPVAAPAVVAPPPAGKKAKAPKKAAAPKPAVTATVATPAGKVIVAPGSEVRISVEPTGVTRVAVYNGTAQLAGKGKPIQLAAGTGGRLENAKTPPKPAAPLPPAPVFAGVQQLSVSAGEPVDVRGTFGPSAGAAPATSWHVQVARDSAFENLVSDVRVASTETRILPQKTEPGDYYIRVSAIDANGAEGPVSPATRVRVARVSLIAGGEGKRAAVAVEGKDLYCSLDGAPLTPVLEPLPLAPARDHLLRCSTVSAGGRADQTIEKRVTAAQSGPLVSRLEPGAVSFTQPDPKAQIAATGTRQVTLVLSDASGSPVSGANVRVESVGGAQVSAVKETQTPGSYVATVTWNAGQTGHSLRYTVNDVETYEGRLPDALPPVAEVGKDKEEPSDKGQARRGAFELGLFPTAGIDTSRLTFNVGAGLDIGGRIRLPYGALAFALRPQYEYHPASPALSHVIVAGLPITYRIRKNVDETVVPYIGVLPQFIASNSTLQRDGAVVDNPENGQWRTAFGIGGLVGSEFRVKRGAVFVEAGYRYAIRFGDTPPDFLPTFNTLFANLGFRLSF